MKTDGQITDFSRSFVSLQADNIISIKGDKANGPLLIHEVIYKSVS